MSITEHDTAIKELSARLVGARQEEAEALTEYDTANTRLKYFRRQLREAKVQVAAGDTDIDLAAFELPSVETFQDHKVATERLEICKGATDLLNARLKQARADREQFIARNKVHIYQAKLDELMEPLLHNVSKACVAYSRVLGIPPGTLDIGKYLAKTCKAMDLSAADEQLKTELGM